ncbi:MAG: DUF342 domain-containing protein [Candidatus Delongbacteria bacterium]|nr:DUF342 domain-containing protein [Candidatus Delongbacteria bacterium]MBN2834145.1 DUF342 domain-containing protein [Candidatus Delongbacteria bacterium]
MAEHIQFIYDEDKVNVFIKLVGEVEEISERYVRNRLKDSGIIFGVLDQSIIDLFGDKSKEFKSGKKILLARGIAPTKGKNGYPEYLISDEISIKENDRGLVDFYDIGIIKTVKRGEKLVHIHPPGHGSPGKNVYEEILPPKLGDEVKVKELIIDGAEIKDNYIVAARDGRYRRFADGKVGVLEEVVVDGDLNFSVGNISTTATINVKRDILSRFEISTTTDINVYGSIEDAKIFAGENLVCRSGILSGEKPITAGTIKAKYITGRKNITCNDIYIEDMISSSIIRVKKILEAKKLTGGLTQVMEGFIVGELGNKSFQKTKIDVGFQEEDLMDMAKLYSEMKKKHMEVQNIEREIESVKAAIKEIDVRVEGLRITGKDMLADKMMKEREKKEIMLGIYDEKKIPIRNRYKELKDEYEELLRIRNDNNKKMIILNKLYPNVTITLNSKLTYTTKTTMERIEFRINDEGELYPFELKTLPKKK